MSDENVEIPDRKPTENCEQYQSTEKPRMMALISQLTSLKMNAGEDIEDYIKRPEVLS